MAFYAGLVPIQDNDLSIYLTENTVMFCGRWRFTRRMNIGHANLAFMPFRHVTPFISRFQKCHNGMFVVASRSGVGSGAGIERGSFGLGRTNCGLGVAQWLGCPIQRTTRVILCVPSMTIRFAGSRHVHERRRRRLAQESDVAVGATAAAASKRTPSNDATPDISPPVFEHSPLHSVIRPQIWIHWCIVALCVGCWVGLLYVGDLAEQTDFGLKGILGIRSGRLVNFFSTIMLLWAGQLALLIYWFRRKSRNDYHGRYRMWLWVGVTLQFLLAVVATQAHIPFSRYMQQMWPMGLPRYDLLSWLLPTATICLALFQILGMELRHSPCSRVLLWIAGISGLIAAMSLFGGSLLSERLRDLVQVGSATLAQLGLATSLLMHARYVIHVSNEAPRQQQRNSLMSRTRRSMKLLPQLKLPGLRLPSLQIPKLKLPQRKPRVKAEKSQKPAKASVAKPKTRANDAKAVTPPSSQTSTSTKRRVDEGESPKGPIAAQQTGRPSSNDEDGEVRRKLSKKERRRLQKQQQQKKAS